MNIIRGALFLLFIVSYVYLVYVKGVGSASYGDFAIVFGLNFFVFIPMRVYQRMDGDLTFSDIVKDGASAEILSIFFTFIALYGGALFFSLFMNVNIENGLLAFGVGGVAFVLLLWSLSRLLSQWSTINNIATSVFEYGNIIDKAGSAFAYVGLITFSVLGSGCSGGCPLIVTLLTTALFITLFSPAIPLLVGRFLSFMANNATQGDINVLFYIVLLVMSIPTIHFSIEIPKDVMHVVSILFSIPSVAFLIYTVNTSYLAKKINIQVTLGLSAIYYLSIFLNSDLVSS